ncbi:carboxypeptidase-like regulatory domain-containing protein [Flavobacterium sp.]|uniref:carboxypeptidase-like regulatory domain-containing protein n=1 Tax=Flavobacterium sp. TaxID=239 RepID=UPI0039E22053
MSQTKIHIPKPCHENWSEMTPDAQGRFCQSCQKTVIDFTGLSDRAIFEKINSGDHLCGRFLASQLDRELIVPKQKSTIWTAGVAGILGFLTLGNQKILAQEKPATLQTDRQNFSAKLGEVATDSDTERIISGTVSESKLAMPSTNVVNKRTLDSTLTDFDGLFKIKAKTGDQIEFSFIGYHNCIITVSDTTTVLNIEMDSRVEFLSGDVYTGGIEPKKRTFFGRMFQSINRFFTLKWRS